MYAGQNVQVCVPLCHTGDLVPYETQHKHTDGPQHIRVDVHTEDSVKKKKKFCKNKKNKKNKHAHHNKNI
jgi:hypothetical protein